MSMIRRRRFGMRTEVRLVLSPDHQKIMQDASIVAHAAELQLAHQKVDVPTDVADALQQVRVQAKGLSDPSGLLLSESEEP